MLRDGRGNRGEVELKRRTRIICEQAYSICTYIVFHAHVHKLQWNLLEMKYICTYICTYVHIHVHRGKHI